MSIRGLLALALCAAPAAGQVVYDEAVHGPLSTNNLNPTDLGVLRVGVHTVSGTVVDAIAAGDVDVFTFEIAAGTALTGLFATAYQGSDPVLFMAIAAGPSFPFNAGELFGGDQDAYLGSLHFGALEVALGTDLLPGLGAGENTGGAGSGFVPPLGPGIYTMYIQQTGPTPVSYGLAFVVVPAAPTGALAAAGLLCAARRRR